MLAAFPAFLRPAFFPVLMNDRVAPPPWVFSTPALRSMRLCVKLFALLTSPPFHESRILRQPASHFPPTHKSLAKCTCPDAPAAHPDQHSSSPESPPQTRPTPVQTQSSPASRSESVSSAAMR